MSHWRGLALSVIGIIATLSLAFSGRLDWYIHPRYIVFTVTMAVLGAITAVLAVGWLWVGSRRSRDAEVMVDEAALPSAGDRGRLEPGAAESGASGSGRAGPGTGKPGNVAFLSTAVLIAAATVALLVIPPATLTAATAGQREMNATIAPGGTEPDVALGDVDDTADLDVKQWSLLLRQDGGDVAVGRSAELIGFVTADDAAPEDIFYVARFSVTCCTIDAQPVGVPVYAPGWQDDFEPDTWVDVTGVFATNPDADGAQPVVLIPTEAAVTDMPEDPYVH